MPSARIDAEGQDADPERVILVRGTAVRRVDRAVRDPAVSVLV